MLSCVGAGTVHANISDPFPVEYLKPYQGQVVLLDFWASWCGPCRRSFPWMNQMREKYGSDGLVVIAVNMDSDRASADKFLDAFPAQFAVVYDQQKLARQLDVEAMPTSFIIGRDGRISAAHKGFLAKKLPLYEQSIREALSSN